MAPRRVSRLWQWARSSRAGDRIRPTESIADPPTAVAAEPEKRSARVWELPDSAAGARTAFIEATGLWAVSHQSAQLVIDAAATAVAHDVGGERTTALASLYSDVDSRDLVPLVIGSMVEMGFPIAESASLSEAEGLADAAISAMCRRFLTGTITGPHLARWAAQNFGYGSPGVAGDLAHIDDGYDVYSDDDGYITGAEKVTAELQALAETHLEGASHAADR